MHRVKEGSKTIILDLFQASSAKKCRPNKGLDSPTPWPSKMTPTMLHCPPKSANRIISALTKNRWTTVPYQNDLSDKKYLEKMKLFSMATEIRFSYSMKRSRCHDMLTVCQK